MENVERMIRIFRYKEYDVWALGDRRGIVCQWAVHEMAVLFSSKAHFPAETVFNEAAMFMRRFVVCVGSRPRPTIEVLWGYYCLWIPWHVSSLELHYSMHICFCFRETVFEAKLKPINDDDDIWALWTRRLTADETLVSSYTPHHMWTVGRYTGAQLCLEGQVEVPSPFLYSDHLGQAYLLQPIY